MRVERTWMRAISERKAQLSTQTAFPGSTLQESTGSEVAWDLHELLAMHERTADEEADASRIADEGRTDEPLVSELEHQPAQFPPAPKAHPIQQDTPTLAACHIHISESAKVVIQLNLPQ